MSGWRAARFAASGSRGGGSGGIGDSGNGGTYIVTVKTWTLHALEIEVNAADTVASLKEKIREVFGTDTASQVLSAGGRVLHSNLLLHECRLGSNPTVQLNLTAQSAAAMRVYCPTGPSVAEEMEAAPPNCHLFVFDMDDTLTRNRIIAPGIKPMLERLRRAGHFMAIASFNRSAVETLRMNAVDHLFHVIVCGWSATSRKPQHIRRCFRALGWTPNTPRMCFFFDDQMDNIQDVRAELEPDGNVKGIFVSSVRQVPTLVAQCEETAAKRVPKPLSSVSSPSVMSSSSTSSSLMSTASTVGAGGGGGGIGGLTMKRSESSSSSLGSSSPSASTPSNKTQQHPSSPITPVTFSPSFLGSNNNKNDDSSSMSQRIRGRYNAAKAHGDMASASDPAPPSPNPLTAAASSGTPSSGKPFSLTTSPSTPSQTSSSSSLNVTGSSPSSSSTTTNNSPITGPTPPIPSPSFSMSPKRKATSNALRRIILADNKKNAMEEYAVEDGGEVGEATSRSCPNFDTLFDDGKGGGGGVRSMPNGIMANTIHEDENSTLDNTGGSSSSWSSADTIRASGITAPATRAVTSSAATRSSSNLTPASAPPTSSSTTPQRRTPSRGLTPGSGGGMASSLDGNNSNSNSNMQSLLQKRASFTSGAGSSIISRATTGAARRNEENSNNDNNNNTSSTGDKESSDIRSPSPAQIPKSPYSLNGTSTRGLASSGASRRALPRMPLSMSPASGAVNGVASPSSKTASTALRASYA